MNPHLELIQQARAGDPAAIRTLIERNQAIVYRLALSLLDDPVQAADAAKETFIAALSRLEDYPGTVAFPTWLYTVTVEVCRGRLARVRLLERLPHRLRGLFSGGHPADPAEKNEAPLDSAQRISQAANHLEDRLRLPLVLRYDHDLSVNEMAPMLDQKARVVQARLAAARRQLHAALGLDAADLFGAVTGDRRAHQRARSLLEMASDGLITDEDGKWLGDHLKACESCTAAFHRLKGFEDELCAALRCRYDTQPVPAADFAPAVVDRRRLHNAGRHTLNLIGAALIGLTAIAVVVFLPSISPAEILPPLATPTTNPTPTPRFRSFQRPTPVPLAGNPGLLSGIYPGRLAYVSLQGSEQGGLFSMRPDGSNVRQLDFGFGEYFSPAWSPDGSRIAYLASSGRFGPDLLFVADADGSNQILLAQADQPDMRLPTPTPGGQSARMPSFGQPRWSPDGKNMVVPMTLSSTDTYLVLLPVGGGRATYLPADLVDRSLVAWSPDGRTIAYIVQNGQELWVWDTYRSRQDGQNPHRLYAENSREMTLGLSWSPDSSQIALMVGTHDNDNIAVNLRIFRRYGVQEQDKPIFVGLWMGRSPFRSSNLSWSPDGKYLAYMPVYSGRDRYGSQIVLIRPDGSDQKTLVEGSWGLTGFTWSPDGRWIAFSTGFQLWGASLDAFEQGQNPLVEISPTRGMSLSWQKVNSRN
jgi:RNA polymerase sigma-70 factor, ECF subfamily